jgi:uncharacterized protein with HEPN domain
MAEPVRTHYKERVASIEEAIRIAEEYRKLGEEDERRGNYESARAYYTNGLKILGEAYERVKNTNDERENEIRRRWLEIANLKLSAFLHQLENQSKK